jgi:hypothetical protein
VRKADQKDGKIACAKPLPGPLNLVCFPNSAEELVTASIPSSCFTLGYRTASFLSFGQVESVQLSFKAICLFNKHVQCFTNTAGIRECAVWKEVYHVATDTCMRRVPDCGQRNKRGQCTPFDYKRCVGKSYGPDTIAQHKDDYCVRTCEDSFPFVSGLTFCYKNGTIVNLFAPLDNAVSVTEHSPNACPLMVVEGLKATSQMVLDMGGATHGPTMNQTVVALAQGPGLCSTVAGNM